MKLLIVILCLVIIYCLFEIKECLLVYRKKHDFDLLIDDFLSIYQTYQSILDSDFSADEIIKRCNVENNIIRVGILKLMIYNDASELRRCLLMIGEFIISYAEFLWMAYQYKGNEANYIDSLEALKAIRMICIQKGEKSTIECR